MRIGSDNNFFSITKVEAQDPYSPYQVEAVINAPEFNFAGVHERVILAIPDSISAELAEFESLKSNLLDIRLAEGGWLRFKRNIRGTIIFHYRLCRWQLGTAFEGEIIVEGEFAAGLCRDLRSLLVPA